MDDLLNVDFSLIDEHLLSFPLGEFGGIDLPEVESILNEIERGYSTGSESNSNHSDQSGGGCSGSVMLQSKKPVTGLICAGPGRSKIRQTGGVSLLAKPPRKLRKRPSGTSLLSSPAKRCALPSIDGDSSFVASNKSNFYPTPMTMISEQLPHVDHDYCLPVGQRPLLLPIDHADLATSSFEPIFHDVDSYFNSFFTLGSMSEGENTSSGNESVVSEVDSLPTSLSDFVSDSNDEEQVEEQQEEEEIEKVEVFIEEFVIDNEPMMSEQVQSDSIREEKKVCQEPLATSKGCIDLNDLNNYELGNGHDSSDCDDMLLEVEEEQVIIEECDSRDEEEEDDDDDEDEDDDEDDDDDEMLSSTEILLGEMFHSDLSDVELIEQKNLIMSKRQPVNKSRPLNKSNSASSVLASGNQLNSSSTSRNRTRTISATYSVRSNSACSCSSDELSDDEPQVLLDSRNGAISQMVDQAKSTQSSLVNGKVHRRLNNRLKSISGRDGLEKSSSASKQAPMIKTSVNESKRNDFNRRKRPQLSNVVFVGNIPDELSKRDLRLWFSRFGNNSNNLVSKTINSKVTGGSKVVNHSRHGLPRSACTAYRKPSETFDNLRRNGNNEEGRRSNLFLGRPRVESRTHTIEIDTLLLSSVEMSRC